MKDFHFYDVDYCKYGMEYRKRTRIWSNFKGWTPRPLCKKDCGNILDGKHKATAQRLKSGKKENWSEHDRFFSQEDLYKIPSVLIAEIFNSLPL